MANLTSLAAASSVVITVTEQQSIVLNNGKTDKARLQITTGPGAGAVVADNHTGRRVYGPFGAGTITLSAIVGACGYELSGDADSPLGDDFEFTASQADSLRSLVSTPWITVDTPVGFRWTGHGLTLKRRGDGIVQTDWQITDLIPTPTVTYYVNPLTGSDANSGLTTGLALANLATALAKADVDQIIITGLTADYIALGTKGWNNIQPTRSVSVLNRTGYRFISCDASATLPTWTVNGTYSSVYQSSAITAVNGRGVTDMSRSDYVSYIDKNGALQTLSNLPKRFRTLKRVASTALVAAEAGTYFHDGTYLQVRAHDDRALTGTATMLATSDSNNGRMPAVSSATIYAENIDFVGGFRAFLALHADTVTGHTLALNGCSFQGANNSGGLMVEAACAVRLYRCGAYDNWSDGFNYHAAGNDAATEADAPAVIEVECAAIGNGATGRNDISDNASTAHEYTEVISLGGVYVDSDDSPIADINNVHRWMMSCHVGAALVTGSGRQNIKTSNSAQTWLDDTYAALGENEQWFAESSGSTIRHSTSGTVANGSGGLGTIRPYLA